MSRRRMKTQRRKRKTNNPEENFSKILHKDLEKNIINLKNMLDEPNDLVIRKFMVGGTDYKCAIAYIDGLVNEDLVYNNIMKNVQLFANQKQLPNVDRKSTRLNSSHVAISYAVFCLK